MPHSTFQFATFTHEAMHLPVVNFGAIQFVVGVSPQQGGTAGDPEFTLGLLNGTSDGSFTDAVSMTLRTSAKKYLGIGGEVSSRLMATKTTLSAI